jgi:hypothetical protein
MSDVIIVNENDTITVDNEKIEIMTVGVRGGQGAKGDFPYERETHVLTPGDILNKYITFNKTPKLVDNVSCFIGSGNHAERDTDYSISGMNIYWNGYEWDGLLEAGDEIEIFYTTI